jgi:hypothetical protein
MNKLVVRHVVARSGVLAASERDHSGLHRVHGFEARLHRGRFVGLTWHAEGRELTRLDRIVESGFELTSGGSSDEAEEASRNRE